MKRIRMIAAAAACAALIGGCGDPLDRLLANDASRTRFWDKVGSSTRLSAELVDRLLVVDSTRAVVLERLMSNTQARQDVLTLVARDQTLMEGAIQFAVQDSATRDQLRALFRGMEMGGGR